MDNIKFYAKTAGTTLVRWSALTIIGLILAIISMVIGFSLLNSQSGAGFQGGHAGFVGAVMGLFVLLLTDFWAMLLIVASFVFLFVYPSIATKISTSFAINKLFENKLSTVIENKIYGLLHAMSEKKPGWLQSFKNTAATKDNILKLAQQDNSLNQLQRKVVTYGLKKVKLDDLNFQQENLDLPKEISNKVMLKLSETAQTSCKPFFIAIGVHGLLLVLVLVFHA